MSSELKRKIVHISMVGFALLIGRLPPWMIVACCAAAFVFNWLIMPRLTGRMLERKADLDRGYALGMLMYPAILFVLSIFFYDHQVFLAVGWGAMAFGDGFAGLVGRRFGGARIAWNTDKRWSGFWGFVLFGTVLTTALVMALPAETRFGFGALRWALILAPAMVLAALAESLRGVIDDNFVVPPTAAITAFFLAGVTAAPTLPSQWMLGAALVGLLTIGSILSRKIDVPGGLVGGVLAASIFLGGGLVGLTLLFTFFVVGTLVSKFKAQEKERIGLAQEAGGKRSVRHAVANGGVAAACGLVVWLHPEFWMAQAMLAAALASATADTMSSELGNVYGKHYINIITFKPDQRGLDGVVSLEGTLLGALGAVLIAAIFALGGAGIWLVILVGLGGVFGNVVDSLLGATLQRKGYMTNDTVNFANTLAGALFVWFFV